MKNLFCILKVSRNFFLGLKNSCLDVIENLEHILAVTPLWQAEISKFFSICHHFKTFHTNNSRNEKA